MRFFIARLSHFDPERAINIETMRGRVAHLYVLCKGGTSRSDRGSFFLRPEVTQCGRGRDENPDAGCMSPHLYTERKGGPAPNAWMLAPDFKLIYEYERSVKEYPNIKVGEDFKGYKK